MHLAFNILIVKASKSKLARGVQVRSIGSKVWKWKLKCKTNNLFLKKTRISEALTNLELFHKVTQVFRKTLCVRHSQLTVPRALRRQGAGQKQHWYLTSWDDNVLKFIWFDSWHLTKTLDLLWSPVKTTDSTNINVETVFNYNTQHLNS